MFKLVRWLFLLGIIAVLAAFLVGKPIHGKTAAEGFCKLIDNPDCAKLAARGAADFGWARSRWESASRSAPAPKTAEREAAPEKVVAVKPAHPAATPEPGAAPPVPATPAGPPLDRHTVAERQALDRILTTRGSH